MVGFFYEQPVNSGRAQRSAPQRRKTVETVDVVGERRSADLGLQHLTQRRGQVLGIVRGHAASSLRHQRAVAVGGVGRGAARGGAVQRIVAVRRRTVAGQVAGRVVGIAGVGDLVGGVVGCPTIGAVAGIVIAVGVARAGDGWWCSDLARFCDQ